MNLLLISLIFVIKLQSCLPANILFLNGVASPSHHYWSRALMEGLARKKDNNLTILSPILEKKTPKNMHYIHLEKTYEPMFSGKDPINHLERAKHSPMKFVRMTANVNLKACEGILMSEGLTKILNYPDDFKFDAVVYDFHYGPCLLSLLHKFNYPPLIAMNAFHTPTIKKLALVGGHVYPAYVAFHAMSEGGLLNFWQRLYSSFLYSWEYFYRNFIFMPKLEAMTRERFRFKDIPTLAELEKRTALVLLNQDYAIDFPAPLEPNVIQVGGLQIAEPKPLPKDLKNFISSSKKGAILMSLGTNVKSSMLPKTTLIDILTAFKELPLYNFLWKFESDELPLEKPENVRIEKFLPQNDLLNDQHVKAFITHCGIMSVQESLWYGKPIIGIPIFGDQRRNLARAIELGAAEKIDFQTLTKEIFKSTILKILENTNYTENAEKVARNFQDKPQKPLERAVWWIEYVLRNKNLEHLKSPTLEQEILISNDYDVLGFLFLVFCFVFYSLQKFIIKIKKLIQNSRMRSKKNN